MRAFTTLLLVLVLGGCNVVKSSTPWFGPASGPRVSEVRSGVWKRTPETRCRHDVTRTIERWPKCASAAVFSDYDVRGLTDGFEAAGEHSSYVLAGGTPRILQIAPPALELTEDGARESYRYFVLVPTARDSDERITAFSLYFLFCDGKTMLADINKPKSTEAASDAAAFPVPDRPRRAQLPPEAPLEPSLEEGDSEAPYGKDPDGKPVLPLPGLIMVEGRHGCEAQSVAALAAAARTNLFHPFRAEWTWVRDGEH